MVPKKLRADSLEEEKKSFIEDVGLSFESAGLPRMAGRILGQLLICEPPHQTAAQLSRAVGGSKGSISTNIRMLLHSGLVERQAFAGQRSTCYRIRPDAWAEHLREHLERVSYLRQMAQRGLALMAGASPESRRRLEEMLAINTFFEREGPALLERYERSRRGENT